MRKPPHRPRSPRRAPRLLSKPQPSLLPNPRRSRRPRIRPPSKPQRRMLRRIHATSQTKPASPSPCLAPLAPDSVEHRRAAVGMPVRGHDVERIWLKNYPPGVPADIDPSRYPSLIALFDESFANYGSYMAFIGMDT